MRRMTRRSADDGGKSAHGCNLHQACRCRFATGGADQGEHECLAGPCIRVRNHSRRQGQSAHRQEEYAGDSKNAV
jgi:hypothetical protein